MLTSGEYFLIWLTYYSVALIVLGVVWFLCRRWQWVGVRHFVCTVSAVLLLMPWSVEAGSDHFAPAILVVLLDVFTQGMDTASRAGIPLLVMIMVATLADLGWLLFSPSHKRHDDREVPQGP